MDGTIINCQKYTSYNTTKKLIQFKLSRQDKIKKLTTLLNTMKIPYTFKPATMSPTNKLQPYMIRIYSTYAIKYYNVLNGVKNLPESFKELKGRYFLEFIKTLVDTDAHKSYNTISWVSSNKNNVLVVEQMCINNKALFIYIGETKSGFKIGKTNPNYIIRLKQDD